ncbi:HD-GYP domain-containing protein [Oceanospirillum sediminis]|uniref:HD-GYP domain-containing protein n=1 Tax=Oceanospirillum sediminis TaxID=2760088 RepID=A0A839IV43_9GAMM|nr:HD-GYP domain-containing protein [Oceanospirillum sediminis]MBB1488474.1 HD-GYP domain-containing protein [Oceanospirillum sediminis]
MPRKIPIIQLRPGMKVVKTDISWDKMPFWQSPFIVSTSEDIVRLTTCCAEVFIESEEDKINQIATSDTSCSAVISAESDARTQQQKTAVKSDGVVKEAYSGVQQEQLRTKEVRGKTANRQSLKVISASTDKSILREKITVNFAVQSYHRTLSVLKQSFDQLRMGKALQADLLESSMMPLMMSSVARPETLAIICNLKEEKNTLEQKSLDVAVLCLMFGRSLGMNKKQLQRLGMAALLHDVGMLKIPAHILKQKDTLSSAQRVHMQKHVEHSCRLMNVSEKLIPLKSIIAFHHERYDGQGYPRGIKGNRIPLEARILGLVATYEAMIRQREYAQRLSTTQALRDLYRLRNKAFDSQLTERFIKSMGVYPPGTLVQLNNGYVGMVVSVNESLPSRPCVQMVCNPDGATLDNPEPINLASKDYIKLQVAKALEPDKVPSEALQQIKDNLGIAAQAA